MQLEYLNYLIALSKTGSINKSAILLNTTPQNVSRVLKAMEKEWNVVLADRTYFGVEFTDAGRAAVVMARRIMADVDQFRSTYSTHQNQAEVISGDLTVAATRIESVSFVNAALMEFTRQYPRVSLNFIEDDANRCLSVFDQTSDAVVLLPVLHSMDTAILPPRFQDQLVSERLSQDHIGVVCRRDSSIAQTGTVSAHRLEEANLVIYIKNQVEGSLWWHIVHDVLQIEPSRIFIAKNGYLYYNKIRMDNYLGLGCVSASVSSETLQNNQFAHDIRIVPLKGENWEFYNTLFYNKSSSAQTVRLFRDFIKKYCALHVK